LLKPLPPRQSLFRRFVRRTAAQVDKPPIDPLGYQPALPIPAGFTRQRIFDVLTAVSIDNSARGELRAYASIDCDRFLHTLALIPESATGRLVEIGAGPYFTTLLLRRFRPGLELELVNYFNTGRKDGKQAIVFPGFDGVEESFDFHYQNVNVEFEPLPYTDASFDYLLFCEVLEHLTGDPMRALLELKRVLKPDGTLILTTPNAVRLENMVAFIEGRNIYDQYSAYGPYGRHNREYTRTELHKLMKRCGFEAEVSFTGNVHPDHPPQIVDAGTLNDLLSRVAGRECDLGQYIFTRWRNVRPAEQLLPSWLYRSYPPSELIPRISERT
jgi:SAM-dependent methyltransferase